MPTTLDDAMFRLAGIESTTTSGELMNPMHDQENDNMEDKPITLAAAKAIHKQQAVKKRKAVPIETPKTQTKAQQKAAEVAARKAEREAAKIEKIEAAAKAKAERDAEKARKAAAQPVTLDGFELAEGVDTRAVSALAQKAATALAHITEREKLGVADYLVFGEFQSKAAPMFKSTKVYGQYLKDRLPASQSLDAALRSNCKWLFENQTDVMRIFGLNTIDTYKSANPTVIKRDYKAAVAAAELKAKAEEKGTDVETLTASEKAAQKAADEQISKDLVKGLQNFRLWLLTNHSKKKYEEATLVLQQVILQGGKKADIAKLLLDLGSDTAAE